jgi:hypothetical protein
MVRRKEPGDFEETIASIESALSSAESDIAEAYSMLAELRKGGDQRDPEMPDAAKERKALEEWNRMAVQA